MEENLYEYAEGGKPVSRFSALLYKSIKLNKKEMNKQQNIRMIAHIQILIIQIK